MRSFIETPLTEEEIEEGNNIIVKYLGYIHVYKATEDLSDIGGIYTHLIYYSKVPLKFRYEDEDERSEGLINDDCTQYILCKDSIGYDADYLPDGLQYHTDWNWIMPVAKIILDIKKDEYNDEFLTRNLVWYDMAYCDINILFRTIVNYIKNRK